MERYKNTSILGNGTVATVYKSYDTHTNEYVAIKKWKD